MRGKMTAGVLTALAFLIPAAPAAAQAGAPGQNAACQTVERKVYTDIRELLNFDLDTAEAKKVEQVFGQILSEAEAESLPVLPRAMHAVLENPAGDPRAFLKADVRPAWTTDLRVSVVRTLTDAGVNVKAAAQKTLDTGTIDAYLAYLNDGVYAARALDCASQPSASPSVSPSATTTVAPTATPSATPGASDGEGGEGGGLPVTGADTAIVAGVGSALLLLGGAGYLIGRRRRSRFVA